MARRQAKNGEVLVVVQRSDGVWDLVDKHHRSFVDLSYNSEVRFLTTTPRQGGRNIVKWLCMILKRNTDPDWMLATWRHVKLPDGSNITAFFFGDMNYERLSTCRIGQMLKVLEVGRQYKKPFQGGAAP